MPTSNEADKRGDSAASTDRQIAAAPAVPQDTTPTWQAELLLSGGIVFALLQVPGLLDDWFHWYRPRLDEAWNQFAIYLYLYARIAVLAMVVSFVAHLALRVLWVALVGLDSVYPHGIRWEGTRYGPVSRRLAEADVMPLRTAASRVDNLSTLVFATGALVAAMSLTVLVLTIAMLGMSQILARAASISDYEYVLLGLLALAIVPPMVAWAIDRAYGSHIAPGSRADRLVGALHWSQRLAQPVRELRQMLIVLTSNLGRHRGYIVVLGVFYLLMAVTFVDLRHSLGRLHIDGYTHVARSDGARNIVAEHYRNQRRGNARYSLAPSIAAPVVEGDWLELFVPFRTVTHPRAIAATCPDVGADSVDASDDLFDATAVAAETLRREAVLVCIGRLHPLAIDGVKLTDVTWDFHTEPVGELAGMLVMIPVRELAPGRHELTMARLDTREADEDRSGSAPPPWRIVFWK